MPRRGRRRVRSRPRRGRREEKQIIVVDTNVYRRAMSDPLSQYRVAYSNWESKHRKRRAAIEDLDSAWRSLAVIMDCIAGRADCYTGPKAMEELKNHDPAVAQATRDLGIARVRRPADHWKMMAAAASHAAGVCCHGDPQRPSLAEADLELLALALQLASEKKRTVRLATGDRPLQAAVEAAARLVPSPIEVLPTRPKTMQPSPPRPGTYEFILGEHVIQYKLERGEGEWPRLKRTVWWKRK